MFDLLEFYENNLFDMKIFDLSELDMIRNLPLVSTFKKAVITFCEDKTERTKSNLELITNYVEKYKDIFYDVDVMFNIISKLEKLIM